ncbi:MAG: PaaI family thioesterase [Candidatus Dormibacteraeota bacterium]|nr:PaaI family thioesterase [Candidatus Dormibacteraeota bacterium]MBV8302519.1 PaaI family thioesterase [Candidatus Dormibacteraeota bacterium]
MALTRCISRPSDAWSCNVTDVSAFDDLYGLQIIEHSPDRMRGQLAVSDKVKQPYGLLHGGVLASIGETLASVGTAIAVMDDGNIAVGMSNHTQFLRPITEGTVHAEARPVHRGRSTWVWDVQLSNDSGALCAIGRVTIAVRPGPHPGMSPTQG